MDKGTTVMIISGHGDDSVDHIMFRVFSGPKVAQSFCNIHNYRMRTMNPSNWDKAFIVERDVVYPIETIKER